MNTTTTPPEKKYNRRIIALSIIIPLIVAVLFRVKIPGATPLTFLPPIYATINGITAVLLVMAVWMIRHKKRRTHELLMRTCIGLSAVFLMMYMAYHMTSEATVYGGKGTLKYIYYFILISHIILSVAVIPLVLITYARALAKRFDKHRKIARITFPIWLYVAVSGVLVYILISPYYV